MNDADSKYEPPLVEEIPTDDESTATAPGGTVPGVTGAGATIT